jgi:hypothetical protein
MFIIIRNEVEKVSENSDEAEESNIRRSSKQADLAKSDREPVTGVTLESVIYYYYYYYYHVYAVYYNYMHKKPVSKVYNLTAILWLQYMLHVMLFTMINVLYFYISDSPACVQRPVWLFFLM